MSDDELDLGTCCACGGTKDVNNINMLDVRGHVPGTGWGCFVCHLPQDGAIAVLCDECHELGKEIHWVVYGFVTHRERRLLSELTERWKHDLTLHNDNFDSGEEGPDFDLDDHETKDSDYLDCLED